MAEGYPKDWSLVHLVVSPNANEIHAVGGDRDSITGDSPYPGLERILERIRKAEAALAAKDAEIERLRREYVATTPCRDPIEVDDVGEDKPCGECEPCKARALVAKPDEVRFGGTRLCPACMVIHGDAPCPKAKRQEAGRG